MSTLVMINGAYATGKTTLAITIGKYLYEHYSECVAWVSIDKVKELVNDSLGYWDKSEHDANSRFAKNIAIDMLKEAARAGMEFILMEHPFSKLMADMIVKVAHDWYDYDVKIINIVAYNAEQLVQRDNDRIISGSRHPSHLNSERYSVFYKSGWEKKSKLTIEDAKEAIKKYNMLHVVGCESMDVDIDKITEETDNIVKFICGNNEKQGK